MRHRKNFNHLGRKRGHRKAMLSNMASSLIIHKRIKTTTAKAKALRSVVEPLITTAKEDTTHSRREVFSLLQDKEATNELFREIAVKVGDRPGGYTRIIKLGARLGDAAEMCIIELVDYNENMLADKAAAAKSSRRRRGAKKKSQAEGETATVETVASAEAATDEVAAETVEETVVEEVETPVTEEESKELVAETEVEAPAAEASAEPVAENEVSDEISAESDEQAEKPSEDKEEDKKAE